MNCCAESNVISTIKTFRRSTNLDSIGDESNSNLRGKQACALSQAGSYIIIRVRS